MMEAASFIHQARAHGVGLYSGVPCSYLKPFINSVMDTPSLRYVAATNEGDAVALAAGSQVGGVAACAMFQNSGLGNAVSPLTSLNAVFRIPVLLICTLRGEPGGPPDEPQHALMGPITTRMLEVMEIPWEYFPREESQVGGALERALNVMRNGGCYALVMKKDTVAPHELQSTMPCHPVGPLTLPRGIWPDTRPSRTEVLSAVRDAVGSDAVLVATTGYTGRALYALGDAPNQFYMVGSMGCAGSFALGLALARPHHRVVVLDGDGAALMRLGAMATVGQQRPVNLLHIILDNESYESTGGQSTVSGSVDLAGVAAACGYPHVHRAHTAADVGDVLTAWTHGLTLLHVKTGTHPHQELPRPKVTPPMVAARLAEWLGPL